MPSDSEDESLIERASVAHLETVLTSPKCGALNEIHKNQEYTMPKPQSPFTEALKDSFASTVIFTFMFFLFCMDRGE